MHEPGPAGTSPSCRPHPAPGARVLLAIAFATVLPRLVGIGPRAGSILLGFTFGEKSDDIARTFLDERHVRLHPRPPDRLHAAALQLLPDPALRGARPHLAGRRRRADHRRHRDGAASSSRSGRRWLSGVGRASRRAADARCIPYSIWHDVHVNREILDGLLAAAIFLVVLALASSGGRWASPPRSARSSASRSSGTSAWHCFRSSSRVFLAGTGARAAHAADRRRPILVAVRRRPRPVGHPEPRRRSAASR